MSVSLKKIDEKLATKRRSLAEAIKARESAYEKVDSLAEQIDEMSSAEDFDAEQLAALTSDYKEAVAASTAQSDVIRSLEAEVFDLESQRRDREEHNRQQASMQTTQERVTTPENPQASATQENVRVLPPTNDELDSDIACFVRSQFLASENRVSVSAVLRGEVGDQYRNDRLHAAVVKSANAALLPDGHVPRLIELLRAKTVIRRMSGLRNMRLINGVLRIPRQATSATANYVGELANIPVSTPTTDQITLSAKKLTVMVVESGEMMRHANPSSDRMILDDIVASLSRKEDITFLRSTASATVPGGLKHFADATAATQVVAANATVSVANVTTDLGKLILALVNADTPMVNPCFVMHPRTERWLMDARDGNNNMAFPEVQRGMLRGFPYLTTTALPINLGGGTNQSEVYFVDASEFILAESGFYQIRVSDEAAYHDGTNVQAAYSQDAVVFRLITEHDTNVRHPRSVAYLSGVTWGA